MKLPSYEIDHFELDNGELINKDYPDSFWIPGKVIRESLEIGSIVKLIFRMEETAGSDDISVERMWVEILDEREGFYVGKLDNDPLGSECVKCGQKVNFQSCHVIDIYSETT